MKILGLDLGSNSIGWALINTDDTNNPQGLIDLGSRIFPKAVEDKTPTPKNHARRSARLARRVIQRRARRRMHLQNYLIKLDLLPARVLDPDIRESALNELGDCYALRAKALDEALSPHELGRVLLHLVARRGFLSNRKTLLADFADDPDVLAILAEDTDEATEQSAEQAKEEGLFKAAINQLQQEIDASHCRTLGEFLHKQPPDIRKRNRRTSREMYRHEFHQILNAQLSHHPQLNTQVIDAIEHIIFYQRPIRWDRNTIGQCSLEKSLRRTRLARLEFQQFRYWQDLNNLNYEFPLSVDKETGEINGGDKPLTQSDKEKLAQILEIQHSLSWGAIRKAIGLEKTIKFNLERNGDKGLTGNHTSCTLRRIINNWDQFSPEQQIALVDDLLGYEKRWALKKRLLNHWKLDIRTAVQLAMLDLEPGYANHSLKVIRTLLPLMQRGLRYDQARVEAGYGYEKQEIVVKNRLPQPPEIRNPIVSKALTETRRVINAVIAQYGKPDAIHIELPREFNMGEKRKKELEKRQKENKKINDEAKEQYANIRAANPYLALKEYPSHEDLLRYRLWKEQNWQCPYSGKTINQTQLFSAELDIDHILPYCRTLNDSFNNKVLAFAEQNQQKGNRTPFEWKSGSEYEAIIARARKLSSSKLKNFLCQELEKDFISSQLIDTAYISKTVKDYVQCLGCEVIPTKGQMTAWLRHQWGLNNILGGETKNRDDHRHHAVDALVVALTSRKLYQQIVHLAEQDQQNGKPQDLSLPMPWDNFRTETEAQLARVIVAHTPLRKISGALHKDGAYNIQSIGDGEFRVTKREPLNGDIKKSTIDKIIDLKLQSTIRNHLDKFNGNSKIAFSDDNRPKLNSKHGKIRHIKIVVSNTFNSNSFLAVKSSKGEIFKYHYLFNYHHVEIVKDIHKGNYIGYFVSTWQAARRIRIEKRPMIQNKHGDDFDFVMDLSINDLVEIDSKIYRVQKFIARDQTIVLREHTAATLNQENTEISKSTNILMKDLKMKKFNVNALGHPIHDQTHSRN